jgi:hypothetical protein
MGDCLGKKYIKYYSVRPRLLILAILVCFSILIYPSIASAVVDITLAWDPPETWQPDGYKIYCKVGSAPSKSSYDRQIVILRGDLTDPDNPQYVVDNVSETETTFFAATAYELGGDESGLSNIESYTGTVANQPPVLDPIGSKSVDEGDLLTFTVTGSDPDGDGLAFSASSVPTGASFNPLTRVFNWTPSFGDSGNYSVTFTVTDDGSPAESDTEVVTISVGNVNRPPVLGTIGSRSVDEGSLLSFTVTASDPDGDGLTFSASNVPTGANFNPSTRVFSWTPGFGAAGNYNVTFTVTDDGTPAENDSEIVTITVGNVNRPPVLGTISSKSVDEGDLLAFTVTASDPDGDGLTFSASNVPTGASFNPSSRVFSWTPEFGDSGNYSVTFTVNDEG